MIRHVPKGFALRSTSSRRRSHIQIELQIALTRVGKHQVVGTWLYKTLLALFLESLIQVKFIQGIATGAHHQGLVALALLEALILESTLDLAQCHRHIALDDPERYGFLFHTQSGQWTKGYEYITISLANIENGMAKSFLFLVVSCYLAAHIRISTSHQEVTHHMARGS